MAARALVAFSRSRKSELPNCLISLARAAASGSLALLSLSSGWPGTVRTRSPNTTAPPRVTRGRVMMFPRRGSQFAHIVPTGSVSVPGPTVQAQAPRESVAGDGAIDVEAWRRRSLTRHTGGFSFRWRLLGRLFLFSRRFANLYGPGERSSGDSGRTWEIHADFSLLIPSVSATSEVARSSWR